MKRSERNEIRICPKCLHSKYLEATAVMQRGKLVTTRLPRHTLDDRGIKWWPSTRCITCDYVGMVEDVIADRNFIRIIKEAPAHVGMNCMIW
ncbi:MAG: hypothetical protein AABY87_03635 [bacterium]